MCLHSPRRAFGTVTLGDPPFNKYIPTISQLITLSVGNKRLIGSPVPQLVALAGDVVTTQANPSRTRAPYAPLCHRMKNHGSCGLNRLKTQFILDFTSNRPCVVSRSKPPSGTATAPRAHSSRPMDKVLVEAPPISSMHRRAVPRTSTTRIAFNEATGTRRGHAYLRARGTGWEERGG